MKISRNADIYKFRLIPLIYLIALVLLLLPLISCGGDNDGHEYFYLAEQSFSSGRLNEASHYYELFLENEPNSPERITAWERLLLINLDIGRNVERGMNILTSMSLEYETEQEIIWSVLMRLAQLYVHQRKFENGIRIFERAVGYAPDDESLIKSFEYLAGVHYKRSDYLKAVEVLYESLQAAAHLSPDNKGRVHYFLGKAYHQLNDQDMAIKYLRKTLYSEANDNQRSKAGIFLFDIYLNKDDLVEAEEVITELKKFYANPMVVRTRMDDVR